MAPPSSVKNRSSMPSTVKKKRTKKFRIGQDVWCEWHKKYYRAKILKIGVAYHPEYYYHIHYWKFSKKWDGPVEEKRLLAMSDTNNKFVKKKNREFSRLTKMNRALLKDKQELIERLEGKVQELEPPYLRLTRLDISKYLPKHQNVLPANNVSSELNTHSQNILPVNAEFTHNISINQGSSTKNNVQSALYPSVSFVVDDNGSKSEENNDSSIIQVLGDATEPVVENEAVFEGPMTVVTDNNLDLNDFTEKAVEAHFTKIDKQPIKDVSKVDENLYNLSQEILNKNSVGNIINLDDNNSRAVPIEEPIMNESNINSTKKILEEEIIHIQSDIIKDEKFVNCLESETIKRDDHVEKEMASSSTATNFSINNKKVCDHSGKIAKGCEMHNMSSNKYNSPSEEFTDTKSVSQSEKNNEENKFDEVVTTSKPEEKSRIDNQQGFINSMNGTVDNQFTLLDENNLSEMQNIILSETPNIVGMKSLQQHEKNIDEHFQHCDQEVSTSKPEKQSGVDQQGFVINLMDSSNEYEMCNTSNMNYPPESTNLVVIKVVSQPEKKSDELHFDEEVTTSKPEVQLRSDGQQDYISSIHGPVMNESSFEVHNISNMILSGPSGLTNLVLNQSVSQPEKSTDENNFVEEVTTSKQEENLNLDEQQSFINSNYGSDGNNLNFVVNSISNINTPNENESTNFVETKSVSQSEKKCDEYHYEEEVTTSKPEENLNLDEQQSFINSKYGSDGNKLNFIVNSISNVNTPNENESTNFVETKSVSQSEKKCDEYHYEEEVTTSKSEEELRLDNQQGLINSMNNLVQTESCCIIRKVITNYMKGNKSFSISKLEIGLGDNESNTTNDCEISGLCNGIDGNSFTNVNLIVTTIPESSSKIHLDRSKNTVDESKQRKKSNVSIKLENIAGIPSFTVCEDSLGDEEQPDVEYFSNSLNTSNSGVKYSKTSATVTDKRNVEDLEIEAFEGDDRSSKAETLKKMYNKQKLTNSEQDDINKTITSLIKNKNISDPESEASNKRIENRSKSNSPISSGSMESIIEKNNMYHENSYDEECFEKKVKSSSPPFKTDSSNKKKTKEDDNSKAEILKKMYCKRKCTDGDVNVNSTVNKTSKALSNIKKDNRDTEQTSVVNVNSTANKTSKALSNIKKDNRDIEQTSDVNVNSTAIKSSKALSNIKKDNRDTKQMSVVNVNSTTNKTSKALSNIKKDNRDIEQTSDVNVNSTAIKSSKALSNIKKDNRDTKQMSVVNVNSTANKTSKALSNIKKDNRDIEQTSDVNMNSTAIKPSKALSNIKKDNRDTDNTSGRNYPKKLLSSPTTVEAINKIKINNFEYALTKVDDIFKNKNVNKKLNKRKSRDEEDDNSKAEILKKMYRKGKCTDGAIITEVNVNSTANKTSKASLNSKEETKRKRKMEKTSELGELSLKKTNLSETESSSFKTESVNKKNINNQRCGVIEANKKNKSRSSSSSTTDSDYNKHDLGRTEVVKQISGHMSNENSSYGIASSPSTSTSISNHQMESDDNNDGQTTDEDDNYVKTRKVSKKRKCLTEDRSIFEKFSFDTQYSRAAKVKANEAISQMSKPVIVKDKKNDIGGKRPKNGKKKDDDDLSNVPLSLSYYNIEIPRCVERILIEDKHLIIDNRCIGILPAQNTVYYYLCIYASQFPVSPPTFTVLLETFDECLLDYLLHTIEKLKCKQIMKTYPGLALNKIYGLPHLLRFLVKLPLLFHKLRSVLAEFIPEIIVVVRGLFSYFENENIQITMDEYENVLPDYFRMAYAS